ncbi:MAG: HIT family protein [Phycisphaerales bacterium]|nr:HIT family protein [Phycisphaerales bacterium]
MSDTIFTRIIRGEIPSHKVYEDEHVFAFLDIGPLSKGHTLVVPKEPAVQLDQLSDAAAAAVGRVLPRLCRAIMQATHCTAYNILQNNGALAHQAVMHVHFHIIPRFDQTMESGLHLAWKPGKLDPRQGTELAHRIAAALATS